MKGRSLTDRRADVFARVDREPAAELELESAAGTTLSLMSVSVKGPNLLVGNSKILDPDEHTA